MKKRCSSTRLKKKKEKPEKAGKEQGIPSVFLDENQKKAEKAYFSKKKPEKFCQSGKKQYLCTRFPENGTPETIESC